MILNTGAPQGCVISPLLYSLFTHECVAKHNSNTIIKFADDTTVVGLITDNDKTAYREEVGDMAVAGKMDLKTSIEECSMALNLVLNNKFSEALDLLKPWWKDSMYHALGYSSILVMQAAMTFEHRDIQTAMAVIKEALTTCQRFRKRNSVVESISSLVTKQSNDHLREEEMHAEICYAECLLQKATLTFVQDENMISFIKGGIKIRTSYQIYKECQNILNVTQDHSSESFRQFEGGVRLGIGSFNLMLSLLPQRILRLLEVIGFSGNRDFGLSQLREGAASHGLRAVLSVLTLLLYHTYVTLILGTGEGNLVEAEALLGPYLEKFPNGSIILFYSARIAVLRGNFEKAQLKFEECILAQSQWRQIHHLCYWELMWSHSFTQDWLQAYRYADLLCKESRWSKAIYVYQKAAILSMLPEEEIKKTGENVVELFRQVEGLKQRLAGKSIPTEKFAVRKSRRYNAASNPVKLVVPALEMMYVWNGFTIVGKRADTTESLLITIEKTEEELRNDPSKHTHTHTHTHTHDPIRFGERRIRYDHYLIPFTLYELGLLYKQQGDYIKATRYIENAKLNYKDYSMESRLHFRIHAALNSLKGSPVNTP
uniref:Tetratricopeptide repeat protein 39B n=1 Tax=Salmo trutta TaxID=8032 RepID=A0A673W3P2_SALTR